MAAAPAPTTPSPGPGYTWDGTKWVKNPTVTAPAPSGTRTSTGSGGQAPSPTGGVGTTPGSAAAPQPPPPPPPSGTGYENRTNSPTPVGGAANGEIVKPFDGSTWTSPTTGAIEASEAATKAAGGTLDTLKGLTSQAPRPAPQVAPTTPITSGVYNAEKPVAAVAAAPTPITAPSISGTTIAPVERYNAAVLGPAPTTIAHQAEAAKLDTSAQDQVRARQLALLDNLDGVLGGTAGSSLAELQGKRQAEEAMASQLGLVAMNHGRGAGAALRTAGMNVARLQQKAAGDAAMLRAKELTDARQQLLTGLEGTRGQDIGVAGKTADLTQAVNLANADAGNRVDIANADRVAMMNKTQAELQQDAAKGNAAAQNELARRNAELEADRKKTEAGLTVDVAKSNQDTGTKVALANAANETNTNIVGATEANKASATNAENDLRAQIANADNETKVALANAGFTLQGREIDDARNVAAIKAMLEGQQQYLQGTDMAVKQRLALDQLNEAIRAGDRDAVIGIIGGLLSAGAAAGAAAMKSDRRAKTDVRPLYSDERGKTGKVALLDHLEGKGGEGGDPVGELLDALHPVTYRYKDPKSEGAAEGQRYGIIAQDLEKSPMGKSIVFEEGGVKKVDTAQAVGVLLAAMARMRQQMKGKRA